MLKFSKRDIPVKHISRGPYPIKGEIIQIILVANQTKIIILSPPYPKNKNSPTKTCVSTRFLSTFLFWANRGHSYFALTKD